MLIYINPNEKTKMTNPVLSIDKEELAKNPNTPSEVLKVLATDKDGYVRQYIAFNPNTPSEVLKVLATDTEWFVRCGVIFNPSTPVEILQLLATDKDSYEWS